VVPGTVEIRDIAGLIKGASSGAGMGNEFLSQIRGVQVILHVVRCFSDPDIVHVVDPVNIDPVAEYESVLEELIIADLELASRRLPALRKRATSSDAMRKALPLYEAVLVALEQGRPARAALSGDTDDLGIDEFLAQLITAKPVVVLANVGADDAAAGNAYAARLAAHIEGSEASAGATVGQRRCVVVSAPLEAEVVQIDDVEFQKEYLESYGLQDGQRALPRVLAECKELLRLVSYLTVGDIEARAWFVTRGSRANEAAGAIHGDFVKNFEQAEIWNCEDILRLGGKGAARKAGLVKSKGKDYEVQDGDVIEFRVRNARS
jgi:GTP-binding protein YchF